MYGPGGPSGHHTGLPSSSSSSRGGGPVLFSSQALVPDPGATLPFSEHHYNPFPRHAHPQQLSPSSFPMTSMVSSSSGSSAAALAMVKSSSSSSTMGGGSLSPGAAGSSSSHAPSSAPSSSHHPLSFHESAALLHRSHTSLASAFSPSALAAASATSISAVLGSGKVGGASSASALANSKMADDLFSLTQSSFGSLNSVTGGSLKTSPPILSSSHHHHGSNSQLHSPTSPVDHSPYGSGGGGGGGSGGDRSFDSLMNANGGSNGARKKQSTRDPLSHRMIEKRRRDRMNNCLTDLSRLIPNSFIKKSSSLQNRGRIEKTEIIEMAIKYMKHLQSLAEPLLLEDGPLGPSPTTTPLPTVDHDQLFTFCQSHSLNTGTALIKDRYGYFRIGYSECMTEALRFLEENGLESWYIKAVEHLQEHRDNISVGIISKQMQNNGLVPGAMMSYEELQALNAHVAATIGIAPGHAPPPPPQGGASSVHYPTPIKAEPHNGSELMHPLDAMALETAHRQRAPNGHHGGHHSQQSYSLNAIKYMIDNSTGGGASASGDGTEDIKPDLLSRPASPAGLYNGKAALASTGGSSLEKGVPGSGVTASLADAVSRPCSPNGDLSNKSSKSAPIDVVNGDGGHFNFKKDIKDRFQKVLDRQSDSGEHSCSVSPSSTCGGSSTSGDSNISDSPPDGCGRTSPGGSSSATTLQLLPPGGGSSSVATSSSVTTATSTASGLGQLASSGSISSNASTLSASETKSVTGESSFTPAAPPLPRDEPLERVLFKPEAALASMYECMSERLMSRLNAVIANFSGSSLEACQTSSSLSGPQQQQPVDAHNNASFIPIFAMHPSGQYYVPMRIEASILGLHDPTVAPGPSMVRPEGRPGLSSAGRSTGKPGAGLSNGDGLMAAEEMETDAPAGRETGTPSHGPTGSSASHRASKRPRFDKEPTTLVNANIKLNFTGKTPDYGFGPETVDKTVLYPISITVNIAFHRTVSLGTLFSNLRDAFTATLPAHAQITFREVEGGGGEKARELKEEGVDLTATSRGSSKYAKTPSNHFGTLESGATEGRNLEQAFLAKHLLTAGKPSAASSASPMDFAHFTHLARQHLNGLPPDHPSQSAATQMVMMLASAAAQFDGSKGSGSQISSEFGGHLAEGGLPNGGPNFSSAPKKATSILSLAGHLSAFSALDDFAAKDRKVPEAKHTLNGGLVKPIPTNPGLAMHHSGSHHGGGHHEDKGDLERLMNSSLYHKLATPTDRKEGSHSLGMSLPNGPPSSSALPLTNSGSLHSLAHAGHYSSPVSYPYLGEGRPDGPHSSLFSSPVGGLSSGRSPLSSPNPSQHQAGASASAVSHRSNSGASSSGSVSMLTPTTPQAPPPPQPPSHSIANYLQPHAALASQLGLSPYYSQLWASQLAAAGNLYGIPVTGSGMSEFAAAAAMAAASSSHKQAGGVISSQQSSKLSPGHNVSSSVSPSSAAASIVNSQNPFGMLSLFGSGGGAGAGGASGHNGHAHLQEFPPPTNPMGDPSVATSSSASALRAQFDQYSALFGRGGGGGGGSVSGGAGPFGHHPIQSISLDAFGPTSTGSSPSGKSAQGKSRSHSNDSKVLEVGGVGGAGNAPMNLTKETNGPLGGAQAQTLASKL